MSAPLRLALLAALVLLGGCGEQSQPAPNLAGAATRGGTKRVVLAAGGVALRVPRAWRVSLGDPPQVATVASGDARIDVSRYPREGLPTKDGMLERARRALVLQVEHRPDPIKVTGSQTLRVAGAPAVELVGDASQYRQVRSLHVYAHGAELALDASAPAKDFPRVDHAVFHRLSRTIVVKKPRP